MKKTYLTNTPLAQARNSYAQFLESLNAVNRHRCVAEHIPAEQSIGRITAQAVYAQRSSPAYNMSAMDGIAVRAADTWGADETHPVKLDSTGYTNIDTGDPLPNEYDAVIMIEDVITAQDGLYIKEAAVPWQHVRQIGEDICARDMLLKSGEEISPSAAGALLAAGVRQVAVCKKPLVAIIPTGDEIVPPDTEPQKGQITEFNSTVFFGMIEGWGAAARVWPIVKDSFESICAAVKEAARECDLVLVNAGSSAGRDDYTAAVIQKMGQVHLHGIAIKPGKPAVLGACHKNADDWTAVMGIPGYTVSGVIVLEEFVKPIITHLARRRLPKQETVPVTLARTINSSLKYEELLRAKIASVGGKLLAIPIAGGAGVITSLVKADAFLRIEQNTEFLEKGTIVQAELLRPLAEIQKTIAVVGSHDPLIDEIADILQSTHDNVFLSSSHVGSTGALNALLRAEAHLGGIHLLDASTGTYNENFMRSFFKDSRIPVLLVEGVKRTQGFITANANPHNIRGFGDIIAGNFSYVNRQKGSGTRVLCDYLLKKEDFLTHRVNGYQREEYTHSAVASIIAAGNADAGLGIYAAAKQYDLAFVPVCDESYDFAVSAEAFELPGVQLFFEILCSSQLRSRLEKLGGYSFGSPGRIIQKINHE